MEDIIVKVRKIREMLKHTNSDPGPYNNWVIPNLVMCGPFPGLDGINYPTDNDVMINLDQILNCGINTFVCLQNEISPQNGTKGEVNQKFLWAFPKFCNYSYYLQNKAVQYYYLGIEDNTAPSLEHFTYIINNVLNLLVEGKKLFIHCAGGHGRTGMVVAALIGIIENLTVEETLKETQKRHDSRVKLDKRQKSKVSSPSTTAQKILVKEYIMTLKNQTSFRILDEQSRITVVGGMSTEMHFAKYYAYRTNKNYRGWDNRIMMCHPNIILDTINYVTETVKSIEVQGCMKPILYSPGFLSVGYIVELCNYIYLPSQFLIGLTKIKDLELMLKTLYSKGIEAYAVVGYDSCIPNCLVAWIKFMKMPYIDLIENYLESDKILIAGVYDKNHETFGENEIYSYSTVNNTQISSQDIYFLKINKCYDKQNDQDIEIFNRLLPDFDKLGTQKSKFVGDWESGIDIVDQYPTFKHKIYVMVTKDSLPLYKLSYELCKKFMQINNIDVKGIVANPYIISNPTYETHYGYLAFSYWQFNGTVITMLEDRVQKDLPKEGTLWLNDQNSTRKDLFDKFNNVKRVYINNTSTLHDELYEWIISHKPKIYTKKEYVSINQLFSIAETII